MQTPNKWTLLAAATLTSAMSRFETMSWLKDRSSGAITRLSEAEESRLSMSAEEVLWEAVRAYLDSRLTPGSVQNMATVVRSVWGSEERVVPFWLEAIVWLAFAIASLMELAFSWWPRAASCGVRQRRHKRRRMCQKACDVLGYSLMAIAQDWRMLGGVFMSQQLTASQFFVFFVAFAMLHFSVEEYTSMFV